MPVGQKHREWSTRQKKEGLKKKGRAGKISEDDNPAKPAGPPPNPHNTTSNSRSWEKGRKRQQGELGKTGARCGFGR